jgi:hypothetical protein
MTIHVDHSQLYSYGIALNSTLSLEVRPDSYHSSSSTSSSQRRRRRRSRNDSMSCNEPRTHSASSISHGSNSYYAPRTRSASSISQGSNSTIGSFNARTHIDSHLCTEKMKCQVLDPGDLHDHSLSSSCSGDDVVLQDSLPINHSGSNRPRCIKGDDANTSETVHKDNSKFTGASPKLCSRHIGPYVVLR